MLKKILGGVVGLVVVLFLIVQTRPSSFAVERSTTIAAPPATVYAQLTDFGRWSGWSPWEKLDPAMTRTLAGTPGTVGHSYAWSGKKLGDGSMTITGLVPNQEVDLRLDFLKPWKATNRATFVVLSDGPGSRVSWSMTGQLDFMGKAAHLFMRMDKMIGGDFDKGLRNLKQVAEAEAARGGGALGTH